MEIRKLQRSSSLLIPNLPFQRVVREVCGEYTTEPFRFTAEALLALQEATEDMLVRTVCDNLRPLLVLFTGDGAVIYDIAHADKSPAPVFHT